MSACSTTRLPESIPKIDETLLETPIRPSLLVPCRVSYPLQELSPQSDLEGLYKTFVHNLGQVDKCYEKDEQLVEEVKERESYVGNNKELHKN